MNYYQSLGYLVLGSRLKRLSELFLSEINKAYRLQGIAFETTWFPVFQLLDKHKVLTIQEIAEQMEVSQPGVSQLIAGLRQKGLVCSQAHAADARKQQITLSEQGKTLLAQVKPVWEAIRIAMEDMAGSDGHHLLENLTRLEDDFKSKGLVDNIIENLSSKNIIGHEENI
ncbi:MarR family winged helix-turn-helix transcriptional regulator [Pedobacter antarcticus]|uniref:MarR family winged helix-turn-helix transcriptional regulator n=1 Tax=Pedobacter antarcticus TaxID=34086 RepID=UPI001C57DD13|nr:MarR family winged helix-turn-helix transcriptional regulator [Pedobacter antarcticus]